MSDKNRLDKELFKRGLVQSRSAAENLILLNKVKVNGSAASKPSMHVSATDSVEVVDEQQYVSRAALKLKSAAEAFGINFANSCVLDVGSSTGGFTDYALSHGAKKVVAVDVGTNQLHPRLHGDARIELHEQTDIREFRSDENFNYVVIDVSFISMLEVLPAVKRLSNKNTQIIAMCKPQFEAGDSKKHKGVIKNDRMRREILKNFEQELKREFLILNKKDSEISGKKGNLERFYLLKLT